MRAKSIWNLPDALDRRNSWVSESVAEASEDEIAQQITHQLALVSR